MDYGYGMNGNQFYGQMPGNAGQVYQRPAMQPQQMFTQQMQSSVLGKMIQAPTDIMPGDIPMNGTPCFFPMQDGSAIYTATHGLPLTAVPLAAAAHRRGSR